MCLLCFFSSELHLWKNNRFLSSGGRDWLESWQRKCRGGLSVYSCPPLTLVHRLKSLRQTTDNAQSRHRGQTQQVISPHPGQTLEDLGWQLINHSRACNTASYSRRIHCFPFWKCSIVWSCVRSYILKSGVKVHGKKRVLRKSERNKKLTGLTLKQIMPFFRLDIVMNIPDQLCPFYALFIYRK